MERLIGGSFYYALFSAQLEFVTAAIFDSPNIQIYYHGVYIVVQQQEKDACCYEQIYGIIRQMYAAQQQLLEAQQPYAKHQCKEGCLCHYLQNRILQLFYVELQYAVISEEEGIRYDGQLLTTVD